MSNWRKRRSRSRARPCAVSSCPPTCWRSIPPTLTRTSPPPPPGELARRGHAKSKRSDLRVVGLAALVSETGHVPLLHRTYPGNGSDQAVLGSCLEALGQLHDALDDAGQQDGHPGCRTLVRDGGSWSEQLELDLDVEGYYTLISLPLSHGASQLALEHAARRGAMKRIGGKAGRRAGGAVAHAGWRTRPHSGGGGESGTAARTEAGDRRGVAQGQGRTRASWSGGRRVAASSGRHWRAGYRRRCDASTCRSSWMATVKQQDGKVSLHWHVDAARRRLLERTRLGRRVLCTDRHIWSTGRIVHAFRGQWNVEELFRRAKKGGVVPWGPSHQWADGSLRLHTFATVIGLTLVSLARIALGSGKSARGMMQTLAGDRSHDGAGSHERARAPRDGAARAGTHRRTA